jgi:alcohol dehydrogenase class IV
MNFEFATAHRIVFGPGVSNQLSHFAPRFGKRALLVPGYAGDEVEQLYSDLQGAGVQVYRFPVEGEPTVATIQDGVSFAITNRCDMVIAIGGGSALDSGKAISGLMQNPGSPTDYLEVVGKGLSLSQPAAPFIAIPTTAGTGSEVTRNAVLSAEVPGRPSESVKVSLRSEFLLPSLAIVDPQLTLRLPPGLTASTGMDALTQVIEPYLSNKANPLTDGICREGMARAARSIRTAFHHGDDLEARTDMSIASLCGGLALANAKLGAVHGFAAPIGGMFKAPHGAICARLLPIVMEMNLMALTNRQPGNPAIRRFDEVARILTGSQQATAWEGVAWLDDLHFELGIPGLAHYGVVESDLNRIASQALLASSMQGNPVQLTLPELIEILEKSLS